MAVIRVTGDPGSGTTTLCKSLAPALGYAYHNTGEIFKEMAAKSGLSIEEFYKQLGNNPELEKQVDHRQIQLMLKFDNFVIDGRMAPFLPCRFPHINILLKVGEDIGARRISNRPAYTGKSVEEIKKLIKLRVQTEKERYKKLYGETYLRGIDNHLAINEKIFQIILHTTFYSADHVLQRVLSMIQCESKHIKSLI